jgi:Cu(I)/Ag(I) efflux system membrane fusion protein
MLKREIHAAGRVALDPDLVLAQNEYLIALRTSGGDLASYQSSLIRASQMRLRALGMSEAQIQDLKRQRKAQMSLLVPQKGDTVWIFGSVFESDLPWVKVGTPVQVQLPGSSETYESHVESIDPMIDFMTRTGKVRLRLNNLQGELKGDMFVRLTLNAEGSEALTLPDNSILDTGSRQVVFVDKGEGKFEPRAVKLGKRGSGYTEVLSGVSQGEKVVTNANFLLDSESRLKAAISGMEGH